jgi:hypothetical protein
VAGIQVVVNPRPPVSIIPGRARAVTSGVAV